MSEREEGLDGIAIIGLAGRFPGASDLEAYWQNLRSGVESISRFSDAELLEAGVEAVRLGVPNYVGAGGALADIDLFDAPLFGLSPREASIMDPQYRLFLETAWSALEDAGYDSMRYPGAIGIYAGMSFSRYLVQNLLPHRDLVKSVGELQLRIYNDRDFLASLAAYKLDLRGPSLSVQTACSTSLVATCLACQSLLTYQSDIALAGGVSLTVPAKYGYQAQEGVFSPDGTCRTFDAEAQGTVQGSGVGLVVLKRLAEAVADGDTVRAVIKGFATNNDGAAKVGYTAPSTDGQAEVIAMAQAVAGVEPESIGYIEAHGTGTPMGDPIEIAALTQAFEHGTARRGFCGVGSVKPNIGHLDAAAGVASLIKTVLALEREELPPTLHFRRPNPAIDFASTPFFVNDRLRPWPRGEQPRRAGVSAFAVGGVNAHVVLEEAPQVSVSEPPQRAWQLLPLSAKGPTALEQRTSDLAAWLAAHPDAELADVAFTLQVGRRSLKHRRVLVAASAEAAARALAEGGAQLLSAAEEGRERPIAFLFPGLGNHYAGMGQELYEQEPVFRRHVDACLELLPSPLREELASALLPPRVEAASKAGLDFRRMVRPEGGTAGALTSTRLAHPGLFIVQYALAQQLRHWGIEPQALAGYSIGQYAAACLAGVFDLPTALHLVTRRAELIETLPGGSMLAVSAAESVVRANLPADLGVAATAGPEVTIVAGPHAAVEALERRLTDAGWTCRRLATAHAFHSPMMAPVGPAVAELLAGIPLQAPQIPLVSDLTGDWLSEGEATDPAYWASHLVSPVRFGTVIETLWQEPDRLFVEVGPGQALSSWVQQHPVSKRASAVVTVPTLRHAYDGQSDVAVLLNGLGRLWLAGVAVDWQALQGGQQRRRLPLPTYPFERQRYWIDPPAESAAPPAALAEARLEDPADWFYLPLWRQLTPLPTADLGAARHWLLWLDDDGLGLALAAVLAAAGHTVTTIRRLAGRAADGSSLFEQAGRPVTLAALLAELADRGSLPQRWVHLEAAARVDTDDRERELERGYFALHELAQALGALAGGPVARGEERIALAVVARGVLGVEGGDRLVPTRAALIGAVLSLPQEMPRLECRLLDIGALENDAEGLLRELVGGEAAPLLALRRGRRFVREYHRERLPAATEPPFAAGAVVLVTGGLGGLGLAFARHLATVSRVRLVLVGRQGLPPRETWTDRLAAQPGAEEAERLRAVQDLEALGAEVLVEAADVTDPAALVRLRAAIRARFGAPVTAIVHAAGVAPGGLLQLKDPAVARGVLAPKVIGTPLLLEAFASEALETVVLCSSLTALAGAFGLADHAAANAVLDLLAQAEAGRQRPRVISINWDTWLEVGQAARAAQAFGRGQSEPGAPARAVGEPVGHLLLDRVRALEPAGASFTSDLVAAERWVLDEHRLGAQAVLPGTAVLEMVCAAHAHTAGTGPSTTLEAVRFLRPLRVADGVTVTAETRLVPSSAGGFSFEVGDGSGAVAASGRVRAGTAGSPGRRLDLAELRARLAPSTVPLVGGLDATTADLVRFGPRWQGLLAELWRGPDEVLGRLELAQRFAEDCTELTLHPALLDAATGLALLFTDSPHLPFGYQRLWVERALPPRFWSHVRRRAEPSLPGLLAVDATLVDDDGNVLVEVAGYELRRVEGAVGLPPARAEGGLESLYSQGLRPAEGADALLRILAARVPSPQWAVSTRDLGAVLARARQLAAGGAQAEVERLRGAGGRLARPAVASVFVAPRTELEERLASLWRELLRLDLVGVHDNFFDLGGDSLVATQLISRLHESDGIELPLQVLFAAPTLAELAVAVLTRQAEAVRPDDLASVLAEIEGLSAEELAQELAASAGEPAKEPA